LDRETLLERLRSREWSDFEVKDGSGGVPEEDEARFLREAVDEDFDSKICNGATIESIDLEAVRSLQDQVTQNRTGRPDADRRPEEFLSEMGLRREDGALTTRSAAKDCLKTAGTTVSSATSTSSALSVLWPPGSTASVLSLSPWTPTVFECPPRFMHGIRRVSSVQQEHSAGGSCTRFSLRSGGGAHGGIRQMDRSAVASRIYRPGRLTRELSAQDGFSTQDVRLNVAVWTAPRVFQSLRECP